ncbi:MAG: hypothetical protein CM15mP109_09940 [Candidatus Dadabacteria bacterium]|nr:MAG: hypothetical protein CM15mP109_09940 [Candidatus Dadabacteria bacterium]
MNPVDHPTVVVKVKLLEVVILLHLGVFQQKVRKTRSNKNSDKFIVRTRHQRKKRR